MSATRLYEILELQSTASPEEIRKAYRRLALVYHPDKAGEAGAPKFREISNAYATLSDPKLRQVYDQYGERGLEYASSPWAEVAISSVGLKRALVFVTCVVFLWVSLLIIFLSFLAAKIDGRVSWTWPQVISPLFAVDGILIVGLLVMSPAAIQSVKHAPFWGSNDGDEDDGASRDGDAHPLRRTTQGAMRLILVYLGSLSFVALTIAIAVGLNQEDVESVSWRAYLVPWYVWSSTYLVGSILTCSPGFLADAFARLGFNSVSPAFLYSYGLLELVRGACGVAFSVAVACRIDQVITVNWFVVAIPLFVAIGSALVQKAMESYLAFTISGFSDEGAGCRTCIVSVSTVFQLVLTAGMPLATILMILSMLQGSGVTMAQALIPLYIIVGTMVLASCCLCCGATLAPPELFDGMRGGPHDAADNRGDNRTTQASEPHATTAPSSNASLNAI